MSRMIPSTYDHKLNISDGEKKIFDQLRMLDDSFVVIHSLGVATHRTKIFSEIDFVIICEHGIMCLEVKGGHVRRRDGLWVFTNRHGIENFKNESPFEQSLSVMFALRDYLKKHFKTSDPIANCCFACGVAFPDMPFLQKGPDIIEEIVFDSGKPSDGLLLYIKQVFAYWRNQIKSKHGFVCGKLTGAEIRKVVCLLRGDFGLVSPLTLKIEQTEEKLLALTKEQVNRLAIASDNPRILLTGGAGTGKTLLSLEYAIRFVLKGEKVLYLCFNNNICNHLQSIIKAKPDYIVENLSITTFHKYLIDQLKEGEQIPEKADVSEKEYFDKVVPEAFLDMFSCEKRSPVFDRLVIDEGQDLLKYQNIICFDTILKEGLSHGNWHIAYDPNQNIYNKEFDEGFNMISNYNPVKLTLDTNCRNTRPVGIYNALLTGIPPAKYFRVEGDHVVREAYGSVAEQKSMLVRAVRRLLGQGAKPGSICLLSRYRYENSCLRGNNPFTGVCSFQDITGLRHENFRDNSINFSTIQSFKGLEAPIIFVLDIDGFSALNDVQLNYVAFSRATTMLFIYYDISVEAELQHMINSSAELLNNIEDA